MQLVDGSTPRGDAGAGAVAARVAAMITLHVYIPLVVALTVISEWPEKRVTGYELDMSPRRRRRSCLLVTGTG